MLGFKKMGFFLLFLSFFVLLNGCKSNSSDDNFQDTEEKTPEKKEDPKTDGFTLTSQNFANGEKIPTDHVCTGHSGQNKSPQLSWSNPPQNTANYALIVDDEVSPCGTGDGACRHWAVYNIPQTTTSFGVNETVTNISGVKEGKNWENNNDYTGPCPPNGTHTYKFTIYALKSGVASIVSGTPHTRSSFQSTYTQFILGSATLQGTFP